MLRKIANSLTMEEYTTNLDELCASEVWNNSAKLQSWLGKKWIPHHHRWVYAFRKHLVNIRLTTTNGLERKHQDLKRNYLAHYGDGTLSTLVSVLLKRFLQESHDNYITYNVKSLDLCRSYNENIPPFLKNRPKMLVEHCMSRLPPNATTIPLDNITKVENREHDYHVKSVDSNSTYMVSLGDSGPNCQCMDWDTNHLPCKHMLAVFMSIPNWTWDRLPSTFRDCPHFSLDPVVFELSLVASASQLPEETDQGEELLVTEEMSVYDLQDVEGDDRQETSGVGQLITVCSHLLKDIQNCIYRINNEQAFGLIINDLEALHAKATNLVPTEENLPINSRNTKAPTIGKRKSKLPLRKNRRKAKKVQLTTKRKKQQDVVIDGTYDLGQTSIGQDAVNLGTITSDAIDLDTITSDTVCNDTTKEVQGTKRKGCLVDGTAGKMKRTLHKKVRIADTAEQVNSTETSANNENLSLNVIGYRLNQHSFRDLESMLPDEIMNAFISLKCRECKDKRVHFVACEVITSIFTCEINPNDPFPVHSFLSGIDIEEYDVIIGALNEGGVHWTLMIIFPFQHELMYLNPLGETRKKKDQLLQKWLIFLHERYNRGHGDLPYENWSIVSKKHRKQLDSNSCGVFVLKFADMVLKGEKEDFIFDTSRNGISALRLEIRQYLVESSDTTQEIAVTQEVFGPTTQHKESTNDEVDDEEIDTFHKEACCKNYMRFKERLYNIINCEDKECKLYSHQRHHVFIANPLKFYKHERSTHCFGIEVMDQRTIHCLSLILAEEMMTIGCDPKKPYTSRYQKIRGSTNETLDQIFKVYGLLVSNYRIGVLLKELIIMIHMNDNDMSYQVVNELCARTEVNLTETLRKSRLSRRK